MLNRNLLFIIVLAVVAYILYFTYNKWTIAQIDSFEECAAKYPVLESYPPQCNTPDGKHFVGDVSTN